MGAWDEIPVLSEGLTDAGPCGMPCEDTGGRGYNARPPGEETAIRHSTSLGSVLVSAETIVPGVSRQSI
jgi:hypothetical protein